MVRHSLVAAASAAAIFLWSSAVSAETTDLERKLERLEKVIEGLTDRLERQELELEQLREKPAKRALSTEGTRAPAAMPPSSAGARGNVFNPEIGVVADITGISTESSEDLEGNDKLSIRELELTIGHDIDPYSRFDSTIAFSDFEEASLEEAYITHWGLPAEVTARLGRFRPKVGKAASIHRDSLDTVDEPLFVQEYLGVEGFSRSGADFAYFIPYPAERFTQDITIGILEGGAGEGGTLFGETRRRPSFYAHLRNFFELSELADVEAGGTYLLGSADDDSGYEVNALGLDATFIYRFRSDRRIKLQSEALFQDREAPFIGDPHSHEEEEHAVEEGEIAHEEEHEDEAPFRSSPYGIYALADYRISKRWGFGVRYDFVEPVNLNVADVRSRETGWSTYLTFYQSEFSRFRFQYQHVDLIEGGDDNRFFLQATAAIGVHKHQIQ